MPSERKYTELQEIGSTEEWTKILKKSGRDTTGIESFLKEGGEIEKLFNSEESKLFDSLGKLKTATTSLLADLEQEKDFEEIRSFSRKVITLFTEKKYLELREKDFKKKWAKLLRKQGQASTVMYELW